MSAFHSAAPAERAAPVAPQSGEIARTCVIDLKDRPPCLVDDMNDTAARDGKIAYRGGGQTRPVQAQAQLRNAIDELVRSDTAVRDPAPNEPLTS